MSAGVSPNGGGCDDGRDDGMAVVDFALVSGLLTLLFLGLLQLGLALHVRNTVIDCAASGARYAALADRTPADGAERTRALLREALSPAYAQRVSGGYERAGGVQTVVVRVEAPLPLAGLLGPSGVLDLQGHAWREGQ